MERATAAVGLLNAAFDGPKPMRPLPRGALTIAALARRAGWPRDLWIELADRLAQDIAEQSDEGDPPSWVDPSAMAALILALVNGVVVSSVIDPTDLITAIAAQFLALLMTASQRARGRN